MPPILAMILIQSYFLYPRKIYANFQLKRLKIAEVYEVIFPWPQVTYPMKIRAAPPIWICTLSVYVSLFLILVLFDGFSLDCYIWSVFSIFLCLLTWLSTILCKRQMDLMEGRIFNQNSPYQQKNASLCLGFEKWLAIHALASLCSQSSSEQHGCPPWSSPAYINLGEVMTF